MATNGPAEQGALSPCLGTRGPHSHAKSFMRRPKILPSILSQVGQTPLVRLRKIEKEYGLQCELLAKCEYFNAGGSVKDRIALRMFEEAEKSGRIKPGDTIIEPTSGNTGLGLALCSAVKGYKCIICMPEKMSMEKVNTLKALGAQIIRTPNEVPSNHPDSHMEVAFRLERELENAHILNQYDNPFNPQAHYDGTAEELLEQCDGRINMFVAGAGTGGTISGTGKKLRECCPDIKIVGCDPVGSILADPPELNVVGGMYQVEGIGYDFVPKSLDRKMVDKWYKTSDKPSFLMARQMIRLEGIMCGGSSGAAMSVAVQAAKELGPGQRCVVMLPDSIRNYMSKFLSDDWMLAHGFLGEEESHKDQFSGATIESLELKAPVTVKNDMECKEVIKLMRSNSTDHVPVVDANGKVVGLATQGRLLIHITNGSSSDPVSKAMKPFDAASREMKPNTLLVEVEKALETGDVCVVVDDDGKLQHVVTRMDLLTYMLDKSL